MNYSLKLSLKYSTLDDSHTNTNTYTSNLSYYESSSPILIRSIFFSIAIILIKTYRCNAFHCIKKSASLQTFSLVSFIYTVQHLPSFLAGSISTYSMCFRKVSVSILKYHPIALHFCLPEVLKLILDLKICKRLSTFDLCNHHISLVILIP